MLFINVSSIPQRGVDIAQNKYAKYTIYLVKYRWHTGIVLNKASIDTVRLPEANDFKNYEFLDIGWDDRDFYIHNGFNFGLAMHTWVAKGLNRAGIKIPTNIILTNSYLKKFIKGYTIKKGEIIWKRISDQSNQLLLKK